MNDIVRLLTQVVGTSALTVLITLGALYLLRTALSGLVTKSVNADLEKLRADMNEKLALLHHQLQREAHKAELVASKKTEVYPAIIAQARAALAATDALVAKTRVEYFVPTRTDVAPARAQVDALRELLQASDLHMGDRVLKTARESLRALVAAVEAVENHRPSFAMRDLLPSSGRESLPYPILMAIGDARQLVARLDDDMRTELHPADAQ